MWRQNVSQPTHIQRKLPFGVIKAAMDLHQSLSEAELSVLAMQPNEAPFSWILGAPARKNVTVGGFPTNNDMVMLKKCQAQKY